MSSNKDLGSLRMDHKKQDSLFKGSNKRKSISHIRENAARKRIYIDHINGYYQHLHALVSMGGNQTVSEIMQKIKGESSFWINKNKLTGLKFEWQDDFYGVSIGMDQLEDLRDYIRNQVQHHQRNSQFRKN